MAESTQLYRQIMAQIEAKRIELGLPMGGQRQDERKKSMDDIAGTADGYYAKAVYPDTPSGRRAGWEVLDEFVIALFGRDFTVKIEGSGPVATGLAMQPKVDGRYLQQRHWRHIKFYRLQGAKGGKATVAKHGSKHMTRIGKRGAKARWGNVRQRAKEITAVLDKATKGDGNDGLY
jgi:hypothetical protein